MYNIIATYSYGYYDIYIEKLAIRCLQDKFEPNMLKSLPISYSFQHFEFPKMLAIPYSCFILTSLPTAIIPVAI